MSEYKISAEIIEMFDQQQAFENCRDSCVANVFGWKRAAHFGLEAVKCKHKAFEAVCSVYPDLRDKRWTYSYGEDHILLKAEQQ